MIDLDITDEELINKLSDFAEHGVDWIQGRLMSDLLTLVREAARRLKEYRTQLNNC